MCSRAQTFEPVAQRAKARARKVLNNITVSRTFCRQPIQSRSPQCASSNPVFPRPNRCVLILSTESGLGFRPAVSCQVCVCLCACVCKCDRVPVLGVIGVLGSMVAFRVQFVCVPLFVCLFVWSFLEQYPRRRLPRR